MKRVLVVDDEEGIRTFIGEVLEDQGFRVTLAQDGQVAAELLDKSSFHLMITDLKMPRLDGMSLLRKARLELPEMEVIVLTAFGTVETAVDAMKLGALDYLSKPLSGPDELRLLVSRALERRELKEERQRRMSEASPTVDLVAHDPAMVAAVEQIKKVAPTDTAVLLLGESGTGKEVAARVIHHESPRREGPFVAINCAALAENLLESEMFGHEKGAFTGASGTKRGQFELADGGTLFLDEVAELVPHLQAKLLRVVEEKHLQRVGGTREIQVNARLVAATNRDLEEEMRFGRFRIDLYHRLAVFPVRLPPLRERPGDILPLTKHLLTRIGHQLGRPDLTLGQGVGRILSQHNWSGNVRELRNVLERAAILAEGHVLGTEHVAVGPASLATTGHSFEGSLKELERQAIRQALQATNGNRKSAASRLGIGLRTLYDKIKEYGL